MPHVTIGLSTRSAQRASHHRVILIVSSNIFGASVGLWHRERLSQRPIDWQASSHRNGLEEKWVGRSLGSQVQQPRTTAAFEGHRAEGEAGSSLL